MKRPTRGDARVVLGHELGRIGVGLVDEHRAELEDLDQLVVEAVALLAEQHRALAVELDRQRDQRHHRRQPQQGQRGDGLVEQPLDDDVPVGDRPVDDVDQRHGAGKGVDARAEAELGGLGRKADVDRQHPQLLDELEHARLGADGQGHDQHVDARAPAELHQRLEVAEVGIAGDRAAGPVDAAVVEHAADADVAVGIGVERLEQALAGGPGAVDDGAAREVSLGEALPRQRRDDSAIANEGDGAADVPQCQPDAGEFGRELEEEHGRQQQPHRRGPAHQQARQLAVGGGERRDGVEAERLEHGDGGKSGERQRRGVLAEELGDIEIGDEEAEAGEERELAEAHEAGEDARRQAAAACRIAGRAAGAGMVRRGRARAKFTLLRSRRSLTAPGRLPMAFHWGGRGFQMASARCPSCGIELIPVLNWLHDNCRSRSCAKGRTVRQARDLALCAAGRPTLAKERTA